MDVDAAPGGAPWAPGDPLSGLPPYGKTYFTPLRGVVPPDAVVGLVASATRQGFRSERGDSKNQLNAAGIK